MLLSLHIGLQGHHAFCGNVSESVPCEIGAPNDSHHVQEIVDCRAHLLMCNIRVRHDINCHCNIIIDIPNLSIFSDIKQRLWTNHMKIIPFQSSHMSQSTKIRGVQVKSLQITTFILPFHWQRWCQAMTTRGPKPAAIAHGAASP